MKAKFMGGRCDICDTCSNDELYRIDRQDGKTYCPECWRRTFSHYDERVSGEQVSDTTQEYSFLFHTRLRRKDVTLPAVTCLDAPELTVQADPEGRPMREVGNK